MKKTTLETEEKVWREYNRRIKKKEVVDLRTIASVFNISSSTVSMILTKKLTK